MVLTNITNKRKMAEQQPPVPQGDNSAADMSPQDLNMPLAKRVQLIRDKQKTEVKSSDKIMSGNTRKTGAKGGAFKTGSVTPFVVFKDSDVDSKPCSDEISSQANDKLYTDIKEKAVEESPVSNVTGHQLQDQIEESVVCIFSRKKSKSSTSSTSGSDDSTVQKESPGSEDDNHNTVPKKKSRRAAIGFPSEMSTAVATSKTGDDQVNAAQKEEDMNVETAIEKLPSPDELPTGMSADQIADIDKLFDSLIPDYAVPPVCPEPENTNVQDQTCAKGERRKSTRRASFILPCHMNQPDIPLLEQTDDCTPIQDKKFRLPSSNEDSFTPSSITPVSETIEKDTKDSTKKGRPAKKANKSRTKKRVQTEVNEKTLDIAVNESVKQDTAELQVQEPMIEDEAFMSPLIEASRPSKAKRRRRSADLDISAQQIQKTPSPNTLMENLPKITARRSNRIKRRSIEIFRIQLRKDAGEESPNSSSDGQDTPKSLESCSKVAEPSPTIQQGSESSLITPSQTPIKSGEETGGAIINSAPSTPDSANVSLNISIGESPVTTPSGVGKCKTRRAKRKREPSIEDIYQNKLWRTQMPKEKNWETIFEQPKPKRGQNEYQSVKKYKRFCNFDDFYNQNRLKKRRQKALKRGWKPLTKRKEDKAGKLVEEMLLTLDQQMIEEEMPNTSISETLALLGEPLVSFSQENELIVTASPTKSVSTVSEDKSDHTRNVLNKDVPVISIVIDEVKNESGRTESTTSSISDAEYSTPNAPLFKPVQCGDDSNKGQDFLSTIGEDNDETFYTPVAEDSIEYGSPAKDVICTGKEPSPTCAKSSDSVLHSETAVGSDEPQ